MKPKSIKLKRIENIKGRIVEVPTIATRYAVLYFTNYSDWQMSGVFCSTPETAVYEFNKFSYNDVEYYTVIELELPIPVISQKEKS